VLQSLPWQCAVELHLPYAVCGTTASVHDSPSLSTAEHCCTCLPCCLRVLRVCRTESRIPVVCAGECCQGCAAVASESHSGPSRHWQDSHQCHPGLPASKARPRPGKIPIPASLQCWHSSPHRISCFEHSYCQLCCIWCHAHKTQLKAETRTAQPAVQEVD